MDYAVTIFERESHAGGVAQWNIPGYRLPAAALEHDLKNLMDLGVELRFGDNMTEKDAYLQLLSEGYDAVFIGCGLARPLTLPMFDGFSDAVDYNSFLRLAKFSRESLDLKEKNVAVIGGGSVAIDAAVSAKACGAAKVYLVSIEQPDELPADQEEINLARAMHVIFKTGSMITGVIAEGGTLTGLTGTETAWIEPGLFTPGNATPVKGTDFSMRVDLVVQAIGTSPADDIPGLAAGLRTTCRGLIVVDEYFATSIPGVFAGGDAVNGGATVVQAVGEGKKAAKGMDHYIKGRKRK
jgi:glutamate synthase (NADPH/NADH) small chain